MFLYMTFTSTEKNFTEVSQHVGCNLILFLSIWGWSTTLTFINVFFFFLRQREITFFSDAPFFMLLQVVSWLCIKLHCFCIAEFTPHLQNLYCSFLHESYSVSHMADCQYVNIISTLYEHYESLCIIHDV